MHTCASHWSELQGRPAEMQGTAVVSLARRDETRRGEMRQASNHIGAHGAAVRRLIWFYCMPNICLDTQPE